ncbi:TonB-dependent receptor plug domain-containing protein [Chitinimonas koreensis]|uniref:TonB-dependent receptor plug domain-containing protein n=1 Tax=Chitinimonas koreensis TaxID=356302 RepID=UPI0016549F90|nr:TonB-dependent receptor [Chitinimonas koreensis]QNM95293.1 TonB-dependent receptor [Chitinimonas koreensis]
MHPSEPSRAAPRPSTGRPLHRAGLAALAACALLPCRAEEAHAAAGFVDLSLEQLANIEVTSVSKRSERLLDAAAAIYVITGEAIRRAGSPTLAEALRLAPNLQVARIDARNYAVAARGFNDAFSNKLLILIDGRVVYSPLFSGVFWDAQDVVLEDIDRIEVISGPGATLWGANAVDGVINILTLPAGATQGALASAGHSSRQDSAAARLGGQLGETGHYRLYAKSYRQDSSRTKSGLDRDDGMRRTQGGFRMDWRNDDRLTVQGDAYRGELRQIFTDYIDISGFNLLARWSRTLADGGELRLQAYYDQTRRDQPNAFTDRLDTMDVELQYGLRPTESQKLTLGAGYRLARDRIDPTGPGFAFLPGHFDAHWSNLLVQDEIALGERWRLTLGAKFERNDYTGTETLPSVRLAWQPSDRQSWWTTLSRAIRAPSRIDRDFYVPAKPPYLIGGSPGFESEVVDVFELGYRAQPTPTLSYSATAYYNRYDKLRSTELKPGGGGLTFGNKIGGHGSGIELWGNWQALPTWRLGAGLAVLGKKLAPAPDSLDPKGAAAHGDDPHSYWRLDSQHDLGEGRTLDLMLRRVGKIADAAVPAYTALDVNLNWQLRPGLTASVTALNLLDGGHVEFGSGPGGRSRCGRCM